MNKRLRALHARRETALSAAHAITDSLADDDDLTDEQRVEVDAHLASSRQIGEDIKREEELEAAAEAGSALEIPRANPHINGGEPQIVNDPKRGWGHFGQFAQALIRAANPGGNRVIDERLTIGAAPTSYGNESVGEEGGYLVPPEFAGRVQSYSLQDDALLPLTQSDPVSGNAIRLPVDETTPWGTDGIRAYWEGEAAQATQTKPKLESRELRLRKLFGLVPITDELFEDAMFLASWLPRKLGDSIRYKTNDAIVNGAGSGVPQGFVNSGALVTQAKEGSQTADTINAANVAKMYARNISPTNAVWLINPDSFAQLITMTVGDSPIWTPPNAGLQGAPNGFLLGRPLIMSENCQTLGDAGDIYFVALNWYQTITKGRGIDFASSMHLYFDYGVTAFRAVFRVDGQSVVRAAVTPPNSAVTRSPFVQLAART